MAKKKQKLKSKVKRLTKELDSVSAKLDNHLVAQETMLTTNRSGAMGGDR